MLDGEQIFAAFFIVVIVLMFVGSWLEERSMLKKAATKPNYELIDELETWELNWRSGCYDPEVVCEHAKDKLSTISRLRSDFTDLENFYPHIRSLQVAENAVLECVDLNRRHKKQFVFDVLEKHTGNVNNTVDKEKRWNHG